MKKKKFNSLMDKIVTRENAIAVINDSSKGFFFIGALQFVLSFWLGSTLIFDASIYTVCAFLLLKFDSRIAASVILLLALAEGVTTVTNILGITRIGGNNLILMIIVIWTAVKAFEATFKLNSSLGLPSEVSLKGAKDPENNL